MKEEELAKLTDKELLDEVKKAKSYKIYDSVIVGFLVGVAIYSSVRNGFGLLTFLPLIYLPVAKRNNDKRQILEKMLKERNLK